MLIVGYVMVKKPYNLTMITHTIAMLSDMFYV